MASKQPDKHFEMLIRIDERVSVLPTIQQQMDKVVTRVAQHGEALKWLTWGVRLGYASFAGMLGYVLFKAG